MKPVDEDRLVEAVQRVKKSLKRKRMTGQAETLLYNISKAGSPTGNAALPAYPKGIYDRKTGGDCLLRGAKKLYDFSPDRQ